MKLRKILIGMMLLVGLTTIAQQEQQYTMYFVNPYTINPAVGGTEDFIDIKLGGRYQWMGIEAAPKTIYLTAHSTLGKEFKPEYHHHGEHSYWHGVGGYVYKDQTGPLSRSGYYGSYSFNHPINKKLRLSTGFFAGLKQFTVDGSFFNNKQADNVVASAATLSKMMPDMSFGMWLYSKDHYIGISAFQLLGNSLSFDGLQDPTLQSAEGALGRHVFIQGGYRVALGDDLDVIPSFAVKFVNPAPVSKDINVKLNYGDGLFVGGSWRIGDSFSVAAGTVLLDQWEVAYSYDLNVSGLSQYNTGTHEVIIGYRLKHPKHIRCPSKFW